MPISTRILNDRWMFAMGETPNKEEFREVFLPHDFAIEGICRKTAPYGENQGYYTRAGKAVYRTTITVTPGRCRRYFLDFEGVSENCVVMVNGKTAGTQGYGYTPFRLEVTDLLKQGENVIEVKVDTTMTPPCRWYSGAGIYRDVSFVETEMNYYDDRKINLQTDVTAEGIGRLRIDTGLPKGMTSDAVLTDPETGEQFYCSDENQTLSFELENVKPWSAEYPFLYTLRLELRGTKEVFEKKVGFRSFVMDPEEGFLVNGKRTILKGVCVHQDLGSLGNAFYPELWRERMVELKEMGCNAIRAAHHVYPSGFYDLADELGFYIYEECFDKWTGGAYGRYYEDHWQEDLSAMILRDRNHPSVFMWGVGNEVENQGQDVMLSLLQNHVNLAHSLDDRPVSIAMNPHFKHFHKVNMSTVDDIQKFVDEADDYEITDLTERVDQIEKIAKIVDVVCCNYQEQWYEQIHERIPQKLILGTETYQAMRGDVNRMQNFTDHNPQLAPFEKNYVIGSFIWTGFDYLGESMGWPSRGWSGAMIRTNGVKKPGFYVLQSLWSEKPMVHFSVLDMTQEDENVKEHWDTPAYADHWCFPQVKKALIPCRIVTNCERVRVFVNGDEFFVNTLDRCDGHEASFYLPYRPGTVTVVGLIDGKEVCREETRTCGMAVQLAFEAEELSVAKDAEVVLLRLQARDDKNTLAFRESARVRFMAEGGEVLTVDNGNLETFVPYGENTVHLWQGQAACVVRFPKDKKRMTIEAFAGGIKSARIILFREVGHG